MLGRAAGRHLHALAHNRDPRPVRRAAPAGSIGSQRARGRVAVVARGGRRATSSRSSTGSRGGCARRGASAARSCCGCASTTSRARPARTRCRGRRRAPRTILAAARALLAAALPKIERRGLTLVGISVANLEDASAVQLALPFDRADARRSTPPSTRCATASASTAITRGVLLGRDPGITMPLLPD